MRMSSVLMAAAFAASLSACTTAMGSNFSGIPEPTSQKLAQYPADGTRIALIVGVGFALAGAALSALRLSPAGARGGQAVRVLEAPRATGE